MTKSGGRYREGGLRKAVRETNVRLNRLFQENPTAAIAEARTLLRSDEMNGVNRSMIAAGILVDAGHHTNDRVAVEEGTALFRQLQSSLPASPDLDYNLANGLNALASLTEQRAWSPDLCAMRREARVLYHRAAVAGAGSQRSKALTNQANLLRMSYRRLEAYDAYVSALEADSKNGVASSGIARLLYEQVDLGLGPKELKRLAARYLAHAKASEAEIARYAGPYAVAIIRDLAQRATERPTTKRIKPTGFAGFVFEHRLALSLSMELFDPSRRFWDDLNLRSVTEAIDKGAHVPPVFAMWNVLKSDYIAARWLAYAAGQKFRETGAYHDTLDYANYGTNQSLAVLAQRSAMDVLDKVAGFATEYLELPGNPQRIYFSNRWHRERNDKAAPLEWQPEVLKLIEEGNPGLLALGDLASDLQSDGALGARRLLRHSGTHRFVILHDMLTSSRESEFVEHFFQSDFEETTVATLQMCRAALTYVHELVVWRERRLAAESRGQPRGTMHVPSHHWIRGR